ncbi:MAG TPA: hypothetical protein VFO38_03785 [Candidatus Saccharimonadales bacterium]|nr:hypothetical protein [Candidatus Saccharimonadales bacterium]
MLQLPKFAYQAARPFVRARQAQCGALTDKKATEKIFGETQELSKYGFTFRLVVDKKLQPFQTEYDKLTEATNVVETEYCRFRDSAEHNLSDPHSNSEYLFLAASFRRHGKALAAQRAKLNDLFTAHLPVFLDVLLRHDVSSRRALRRELAAGWDQPDMAALLHSTKTEVSALKKKLKESGPAWQDLPDIDRLLSNTLLLRSAADDLKIRQNDLNRTAEAFARYNNPHTLISAAEEALTELKKKFDYSYYGGTQKPLEDAITVIRQLLPTLAAFGLAVKRHKFEAAEAMQPSLKPMNEALRVCSNVVNRHKQAVKTIGEVTRQIGLVNRQLGSLVKQWPAKTNTSMQSLANAKYLASVLLKLLQNPFEKYPPLEAIQDQLAVLTNINEAAQHADGKDYMLPAVHVVEGLSDHPAFMGL